MNLFGRKREHIRWRTASASLLFEWPRYIASLAFTLRYNLFHRRLHRDSAICDEGFDIITVVYGSELSLIRLQALSIARFLDPGFPGDIVLIVNDISQARVTRAIKQIVLDAYGPWRERVRIVPFFQIGERLDPSNGWIVQQALKLSISSQISRPFYLVLDAKNHLIRPTATEVFVTATGIAIQQLDAERSTLPSHYETCVRYFGLDPTTVVFNPCIPMTPFVFHTRTVRDMVSHMEAQEGKGLCAIFCQTRLLSEFLLYRVYLHITGRDITLYQDGPLRSETVWLQGPSIKESIRRATDNPNILMFAVHLKVLKDIQAPSLMLVEHFLRGRGILASIRGES